MIKFILIYYYIKQALILYVQVFDVIWHRIDLFLNVKICHSLIFNVIYFLVPKMIFIFKSTIYKKRDHQVIKRNC